MIPVDHARCSLLMFLGKADKKTNLVRFMGGTKIKSVTAQEAKEPWDFSLDMTGTLLNEA